MKHDQYLSDLNGLKKKTHNTKVFRFSAN